jgi:protein-tyrosine phosphatase
MTKPIDNSFWVIPDVLLAGEHPGAAGDDEMTRRLRRFLVSGVSQFIDLSDKKECLSYDRMLQSESEMLGIDARYSHHPIRDKGIPRSPVQMAAVFRDISDALAQGQVTYIHANRGVGRTGVAVGCYLVECGLAPDRAIRKLAILYSAMERSAWEPSIPETEQQIEYIRNWEAGAGQS